MYYKISVISLGHLVLLASRGRGVHKFSNCHHSMSSGANLLLFVALDSLCQGLCSDAIIGLAGMIGHRFSFLHRPPSTAS